MIRANRNIKRSVPGGMSGGKWEKFNWVELPQHKSLQEIQIGNGIPESIHPVEIIPSAGEMTITMEQLPRQAAEATRITDLFRISCCRF